MSKLFISYRRSDTQDITGRIYDRFAAQFGSESVFMDVDTIPPGLDFRDHLTEWISTSDVVLVVIGSQWLEFKREDGQRGLEDLDDFVRIELNAALERKIPVIPVLVGEVSMPTADQLPEGLKDFAYRNAVSITSGRDFSEQVNRLIHDVEGLVGKEDGTSEVPSGNNKVLASKDWLSPFNFLLDNLNILYRVVVEGHGFIRSIDHASPNEFSNAIKYAAFLSLLGVVVSYPWIIAMGVDVSFPFLIVDTVTTVILFFVLGAMNHVAAKIVFGKGSLRSSVVVTIYLSTILMATNLMGSAMPELMADFGSGGLEKAFEMGSETAEVDPTIAIVGLIVNIIMIYWFYLQTVAFKNIHHFSILKTIVFVVLSIIVFGVFTVLTTEIVAGYHQSFIKVS